MIIRLEKYNIYTSKTKEELRDFNSIILNRGFSSKILISELKIVNSIYFYFISQFYFIISNLELEISILYMTITNSHII